MKKKLSKMMVILLSLMMTMSSFISFSFAEDTQDQEKKAEATETVVEKKAEPAEVKAPAPEPEPEPEPVVEAPPPPQEPEPVVDDSADTGGDEIYEEVAEDNDAPQVYDVPQEDESDNDFEQVVEQNDQNDNTEVQEEVKKEEKDEDEEEKMTAQSFSGSAGGLSVNASAPEGAFPEGTSMVVSPANIGSVISMSDAATGEDFTVVDAVAADISFYKNGKEIQPANGKAVSVKLRANYAVGGEEHSVIHVSGGGVDIIGGASAGGASVKAGSFSVYGIIGGNYDPEVEEFARYTYNFKVDGELIGSKIVRDGDTLEAPSVNLDEPNRKFLGWYDEDDTKLSLPKTIEIPDTETEDKSINLIAKFDELSNVTFMSNSDHVLAVKSGVVGETVSTDGIDIQVSASQVISGWTKTKGSTSALDNIVFEDDDYVLYPVIDEVAWVTFDSNAGGEVATYIDSVYVKKGGKVNAPSVAPKREGWTFDGWYTEAEGGSKVVFPMTVTEDTTVYAHWKAGKTSYTVRVWKEALAGGEYSAENYALAMTEVKENVDTGSKVSGSNSNSYNFSDKKYYDFDKADKNVEVKGDGTTIVNVYYKLKVYTLRFNLKVDNLSGSITKDGTTYGPESNTTYSFKARYGEYIFDKWPQQSEVTVYTKKDNKYEESKVYKFVKWGSNWATWRYTLAEDIINNASGTTITYNATYERSPSTYKAHYYKQSPDNPKVYEEDVTLTQTFWYSGGFGQKELAGFTYIGNEMQDYPSTNTDTHEYYFYYDRNKLTLTFVNGGRTDKTETVVYEQSLSKFNYEPKKPASIAGEATFAGWYTDESCSESTAFDLENGFMTANNLTLYAKWASEQYTVSFDMNGATSTPIEAKTVDYGATVAKPDNPERTGLNFGGWLKGNAAYNFNELVTSDFTLTAKWLKAETEFQVVYIVNGEVVSNSSDKYCDGSNAVALGRPAGVPLDKAFTGWSYSSQATKVDVEPGKSFLIDHINANDNNSIVLYAVLVEKEGKVKVTYSDGNGKTKTVENLVINGNYTLATVEECGFEAPEGQEFAGWKNAGGETFGEKAVVAVGLGENVLTAQWKDKPKTNVRVTITGSSDESKVYNGSVQSVEGFTVKLEPATSDGADVPENAVSVKLKEGREAKASGTNTGTYNMGLTKDDFVIEPAEGYAVVRDPQIIDGKMKIAPYDITVKIIGETKTVVENDQLQSVSGFKAEAVGSGHPSSFDLKKVQLKEGSEAKASGTIAGTYYMELTKDDFSYEDGNFTVSFQVTDGELTITPRTKVMVIITGKSDGSKVYNGEEQTIEGFDYRVVAAPETSPDNPILRVMKAAIKGPEHIPKDAVSVELKEGSEAKASGTDAGTYYMNLEPADFVIVPAEGYKLVGDPSIEDGEMTINPYELTVDITGETLTVPQNGKEQSVEGFKAAAQGTDVPKTFNIANIRYKGGEETPVAKGIDPDTYYMGMSESDFSYDDEGKDNFALTFNISDGKLIITAHEVEKEEDPEEPEEKKENESDVLDDVEDDTDIESEDNNNGKSGSNGDTRTSDNVKSAFKSGVKTGDNNSMFLYIIVFCLGVVSLIMMGIARSKPSRRK